ncbi:MAG: TIGR03087 family PEP-CTERM/XrtA system glycosyltransferase [Paucibacter sp.]|nr:TIGR03087 family PEP-CTERM/XrtA system glycosyltransferase [Roseateles sp.]
MSNLLYFVHRLPYPPNKGDKLGSYHLLAHLAKRHKIYLGTFVDDPDDWQYVDVLRSLCAEVRAVPLHPGVAKIGSARGLLSGEALSLPFYRKAQLMSWARDLATRVPLDASVIYSGVMAQYAMVFPELPMLLNFADVDSAKWTQYAPQHRWPMSWVYAREGRKLLAFEQEAARAAQCSFFVTANEVALFRQLSPGLDAELDVLGNGVDADRFAPDDARPNPFQADEIPLVFTGAMDYWPNVDAVSWFAEAVLPQLRQRFATLRFHIVGRSPAPAVQALAQQPGIKVTGTVPDVRPYLQHAAAVVAPLRVARGIQNKVLEAMAMGQPVVVARNCAEVISPDPTLAELLPADSAEDYVAHLSSLIEDRALAARVGAAGRQCVLSRFSWDAHLSVVDRHLDALLAEKETA